MDASYIPIAEAGGFTTHWIKILSGFYKASVFAVERRLKIYIF